VAEASHAVFLSYASQDAEAAQKICDALRAAGIEVFLDRSELRGGDSWDQKIRHEIHDCVLFIPIVSQHTQERLEGYFRHEWKLAIERTHHMAEQKAFLVPVVVDGTGDQQAFVPDAFRDVQWTRLPAGDTPPEFVTRIQKLLSGESGPVPTMAQRPAVVTSRRSSRLVPGMVTVVLAAIAAYLLIEKPWVAKPVAFAPPAHSIAVLPFVNMSGEKEQEYFADGMAEEIINLLTKIPNLKVIGRTSSFQFKGKTEDLRTIGSALSAAYVVEGSVRRSGDHVRVTAQLIDTRDGAHRWSDSYDRDASDVLKVQDEIATGLVRALQLEVAPSVYLQSRAPPRNSEAYDAYLRGLHAMDRFDESGLNEAIADFRHALELDPSFVAAGEGLAWALGYLAFDAYVPAQTGFDQTRAAAQAVLRLDPKSATAHTVLAIVHVLYDWDWPAAEQEAKTAMALAPNSAAALTCAAQVRIAVGQWNDAVRLTDAAVAADPLDANIYLFRVYSFLRLSRMAEAERANRRMLEISPTYAWGQYFLAMVLLAEGNAEAALAEIQKEAVLEAREAGLVVVYGTLHRSKDAESAFARLEVETRGHWPLGFAFAYAARGQRDRALESLERAYATKDSALWAIKGHPWLKSLEQDARYKAFLRKMNLPE
jgi:TolB-like protein